ncbi:hypothetical protein PAXRUDRAFT_836245, partial [Paxillus rubicundulus Ve08.2h10]
SWRHPLSPQVALQGFGLSKLDPGVFVPLFLETQGGSQHDEFPFDSATQTSHTLAVASMMEVALHLQFTKPVENLFPGFISV